MIARDKDRALQLAGQTTLTDEEIVRRVLAGEPALYEVLMRRHNARVYRVVRAILRDESETEDAMQQAYLAAYRHLDQLRGEASFRAWLLRIAAREALGRARRRGRLRLVDKDAEALDEAALASPLAGAVRDPEEKAMAHELAHLLESALDRLPEMYSAVLVMREVDGLDTAETAEALDVSVEVVKTRLHRARAMLRDQLARDLGTAAADVFPFHASRCDRVVAWVMAAIGGEPA